MFHTNDLALLWDIADRNTLYTTVKRYIKRGVLTPIHKGFYTTGKIESLDPVELGIKSLHRYAYLSTESVLVEEGIILQEIVYITLVSDISRQFQIIGNSYRVRKMESRFLYQTIEITDKNGYKKATVERAVADLLYFNPRYHLDGAKLIDWGKVKFIQKEVGFK